MTSGADPSRRAEADPDDPRPVVALPSPGPPAAAIVGACVVLGLGLFVFLEGQRHRGEEAPAARRLDDQSRLAPAVPPLAIPAPRPAPPPVAPQPTIRYIDRPAPPPPPLIRYEDRGEVPAPPPIAPRPARSPEPALVIDLGEAPESGQAADDATAHATVLHHKSMIVPEGTIVPAVLETPIDSMAPGPVRAITSTDTRGFDGARVLIPKGSRLLGEYRSDVQSGQARVLVTWFNLIRPDGVSIHLNSPAADRAGGPGVPGALNNHFAARLGSAVLQSALAVGVNLASRPGANSVIIDQPVQTTTTAGQSLIPSADARPTIKVKEGADISVFVSRDLDFSHALPRQ